MSAKASIPIRVEVDIYNLVEKTKQERDCTQVEAVNYLFSKIQLNENENENEDLKKIVEEKKTKEKLRTWVPLQKS